MIDSPATLDLAGFQGRVVWRVLRWSAVVALAIVGVAATGLTVAVIPVLYLAAVTPELVRVDAREHRLPNRLVVPGVGVGLAGWGTEAVAALASGGRIPLTPLLGGGAFALFLLALCLLGGVGMGDVKLAAALGLASWVPFVAVLSPVVGFLIGGVGSVVLIVRHRFRNVGNGEVPGSVNRMAFGPYLLAGFWFSVTLVAWARLAV